MAPIRLPALVAVLSILLYFFLSYTPTYHFTPSEMHTIARSALSLSHTHHNASLNATITSVIAQLRAAHPAHILRDPPWMLNNAGGAMGAMLVLHCSLSEYVIIFGTAIGTEGHTGRFLADDWFTMLRGEQWAFAAGALEKEVYREGEQHYLPRGVAKGYRMPGEGWALEYARGNIVSMMPFGLADSFSSTFDMVSVWETVRVSAKGMSGEIMGWAT